MTKEQYEIYKMGLQKQRDDELYEINSKIHRLKYDILASFNEPFNLRDFKLFSKEMIQLQEHKQKLQREEQDAIS